MIKQLGIILILTGLFTFCSHSTVKRFTFHKLSANKIIIIDQKTGKVAKYEYSVASFSPGSLTFFDLDWTIPKNKK